MTMNIMLAVIAMDYGFAGYLGAGLLVLLILMRCGFVLIRERQVGIVVKRFSAKSRMGRTPVANHRRGHFQDLARQLTSQASGRAIL